ncbi:MAG: 50S ribosomal protein L5 [Gemmatimonadetes bacterium]|nr:50S ribosomal protein L5 [Gemmatimonadota bacterium]
MAKKKGEKPKKAQKGSGDLRGGVSAEKPREAPREALKEPRLVSHYRERVKPKLREEFGFTNDHQIPQVVKVVVNVGIGDAGRNQKLLDSVVAELATICGQRPVITKARKSIANFALREGMPVGVSVTLRRGRMYEFLDRLISAAIPRVRDFRGLPTRSFDGRGNYTLGVKEQIIFPEIEYDSVEKVHGMDITVVTSTDQDAEAYALLREMGFPFRGEMTPTPILA